MNKTPVFINTLEDAHAYFSANGLHGEALSQEVSIEGRCRIGRLIEHVTGAEAGSVRTERHVISPEITAYEQYMWEALAVKDDWDVCPEDLVAAEGESLVVVFEEPDLPAFVLSDKSVRVEQFTDADVYVAPTPSFAWVFAQTHESAFGPYFASAPPAE